MTLPIDRQEEQAHLSSERSRSTWLRIEVVCSLILLVAQPVIFYWKVLVNPRRHIPFDIQGFHYPLIAYVAQCVRHGIAPFWNPWQYCGVPIHADPQAQAFYPFTWIAIVAGNHSAGRNLFYWVEWQEPLHMILAGVFAFFLLRHLELRPAAALMGATVYQLGGYFASQAQHLGAICCGAWLPLAILAVLELRTRIRWRWIAVLAIALAMSILSGFMAATLVVFGMAGFTAVLLIVFRQANWRVLPALFGAAVWGAAIAAITLIPASTLSRLSMVSLRASWGKDGAGLPLQSLISLIIPDYYHIFEPTSPLYTLHMDITVLYVYCGILTVVLVLAAPFVRSRWMPLSLTMLALSAIWMLGSHTIIFRAVFAVLPGMIRGAVYAWFGMMAFSLFAGMTAAIVLDRLGTRVPAVVLWVIALLSTTDLIHTSAGRPMNSGVGSWKYETSEYGIGGYPGSLAKLRDLVNTSVPPVRIDYSDRFFYSGLAGPNVVALPTADGDNPFLPLRMLWLRRLFCRANFWERNLPVNRFKSPLLDMVNAGWIGGLIPLPPQTAHDAGLESAGSIAGLNLYRNPRYLPRFFFVPAIQRSSGATESLRMLSRPDFNPAAEAIVENTAASVAGLSSGSIVVERYEANRVRLRVATHGPAFLVTSEAMYPGWEATVDGRRQPVLMTNEAFRGLFLPAGASAVEMTYHPRYFSGAALLSLVALLAAVIAVMPRISAPK